MQNKHKTISVRRYINTFLIVASILVSILHLFVFVESFLYFDMADEATIVCIVAGLNLIISFFDATTLIVQTPASEVPKRLQGIRLFFIVLNRCKMLICHDISSLVDICFPAEQSNQIKSFVPRLFLLLISLFFAHESRYLVYCGFSSVYTFAATVAIWCSVILNALAIAQKYRALHMLQNGCSDKQDML